ncbi:hypothetical protein HYPGJ_20146 [Hyphomicrobium sp. GJ21]|nr:hypothetical protein HYPGJ_20146 [Hyphomicrobium sp. GJ21]
MVLRQWTNVLLVVSCTWRAIRGYWFNALILELV